MSDENKMSLPDIIAMTNESFNQIMNDMSKNAGVQTATSSLPKAYNGDASQAMNNVQTSISHTDIANQVGNYRESYTDTCFRRTAPYGGTMPVSYERWLRAVDIATQKNKGKRVKADVASAIYAQVEKETQSTYANLCRMTAEPFPLVSSGRASDSNSDNVKEQPLIDPQNGTKTASRYARVCLSELGEYATKWYHNTPMENLQIHKCIVPLSLLRKTQPWSLGFRSEMRPLNPSELFNLMIKMIERDSPELDDATLQQYFKGPDLGTDYNIFMTNESLMSLYSAGKGSITVTPDILIDRNKNRIVIKRPVLDQTSQKLATELMSRLRDAYVNGKQRELFQSFVMDDLVVPSGKNTYINVKEFLGTDAQIYAEITSMPEFQKTISLTSSVLLPTEGEKTNINKYEGINYKCELMSVKDTLWMHIQWERENVRRFYNAKLQDLRLSLEKSKLLDKVTRPKVADFIHSIMRQPDRNAILAATFNSDKEYRKLASRYNSVTGYDCSSFMENLIEEGKKDPNNHDYWYEGEYFSSDDVLEIYKEKGGLKVGSETINILSILFMREKYKNYWEIYENAIKECEALLSNPKKIDKEILIDLERYAAMPSMARKSRVFFLTEDIRNTNKIKKHVSIDPDLMVKPQKLWDMLVQPVTIYYNEAVLYKSYGVNMNIFARVSIQNSQTSKKKPNRSINCLNNEILILYTDGKAVNFKPCDISHMPYKYDNIQGIIPYSLTRRILVLTSKIDKDPSGVGGLASAYLHIIPKGEIMAELGQNETISSWVYLDDKDGNPYPDSKCVVFLLYHPINNSGGSVQYNVGVAKVLISKIKETPNGTPSQWGLPTDMTVVDVDEKVLPGFYPWNYDSNVDNISTPKDMDDPNSACPYVTDMQPYAYSTNIEFYMGREYIGNWETCGIVKKQTFPHGKKGVIQENRFLYRREAVSEKILNKQRNMVIEKWRSICTIYTKTTDEYKDWNLSELTDWSILDKRWRFPSERPNNQAALDYCDKFFKTQSDFCIKIVESPINFMIKADIDFVNTDKSKMYNVNGLKDGFEDSLTENKEDEDITINTDDDELDEIYRIDNGIDNTEQ